MDAYSAMTDLSLSTQELRELRVILEKGWFDDTAHKPTYYRHLMLMKGCRSYGQCWNTARVLQEVFGWKLVIRKWSDGGRHVWNIMPNGREVDFTSDQGGGNGIDPFTTGIVSNRKAKTIVEADCKRLTIYYARVKTDLFQFRQQKMSENLLNKTVR